MAIDIYALFQNYGIFDIFAPFIVSYTLVHGTLRKIKLFGDNEKAYGIIAFAVSIYFIYNLALLQFAQRFFAAFFYLIVLILFFLMVVGMVFGPFEEEGHATVPTKFSAFAIFVVFLAFLYALQTNPNSATSSVNWAWQIVQDYLINTGLIVIIGIFATFFIMYKWFTAPPKKSTDNKKLLQKIEEEVDNLLDEIRRIKKEEKKKKK